MATIALYNVSGVKLYDLTVTDESNSYASIMSDNILTLNFSSPTYLDIPIGSYVDLFGERYALKKDADYKKNGERGHEYTLSLETGIADIKRKKVRNTSDGRLTFTLTARPIEHLQIIIDSANVHDSGWTMGSCIDDNPVTISYNHTFIIDALNSLANECSTEFEIKNKAISLGKVEYNYDSPLVLGYKNGFEPGVKKSEEQEPFEILLIQGTNRNIDYAKYGNKTLLLPKSQQLTYNGKTYESLADGTGIKIAGKTINTGYEDSLDCTTIYPSRVGTVSEVIAVDANNHIYDFTDTSIPQALNFSNYIISGSTMTVVFQTGMLAGKGEFEVAYFHEIAAGKKARRFEIVSQEIDGIKMPDPTTGFLPAAGDKYIVLNIQLPDAYICDSTSKTGASWDMFAKAAKYFDEHGGKTFTLNANIDGVWSGRRWASIKDEFMLGGYIQVADTEFVSSPTKIRITGIKRYVNTPYKPEIELSNKVTSVSVSSSLEKASQNDVAISDSEKSALNYVNNQLKKYVTLGAEEVITGKKTFTGGLFADSAEIDETSTKDLTTENEALLKKGFKTDNFVSGNSGGEIDNRGNGELESLSVRSYLKVAELIYNRLSAMEGDFAFSEFGTIDSVSEVTSGTYNVHFRKRYDNDFIAFHENDILMGVVDPKVNNTGTILYTSYMRVLSINTTDNTAQLLMYDNGSIPSGTNRPPVISMNVIRIGNTDSPVNGSVNTRQDFWKLSTDEGRIVFLQNVYKPILEAFNYALSIGKLPDLDIFKNLPIGKDDMSIYSKNVVAQNYYKIDSNGIVQTNEVYRGLWSEQVASSEAPYRRIVKETTSGTGTIVNVLELHTVYHLGCKWACLVDKTTEEPKWNSTGWQMIQGDSNYSIDFSSTNGWQFFYGKVDTTISARMFYGNEDITERTLPLAGVSIEWVRNTDNVPEDNAWIPTFGANKLNLKLTTEDMGSNWMTKRTATFTCNIYIPVGEDTQLVYNNISFNL